MVSRRREHQLGLPVALRVARLHRSVEQVAQVLLVVIAGLRCTCRAALRAPTARLLSSFPARLCCSSLLVCRYAKERLLL